MDFDVVFTPPYGPI